MVDSKTIKALSEALEDEYRARATYRKVIEAFGPVRPFVNIVEAEERHAKALFALFQAFGVEPPQDTWAERVTTPPTLAEACRMGVEAEIENAAMYDRLIDQISNPGARDVMRRLQRASQERHLPAFRRCLERETCGESAGLRTDPPPRRARIRRRGS